MIPYQVITVEIAPKHLPPVQAMTASQYDNGRPIKVLLTNGGTAYNLPAGVTAQIQVLKPSGKIVIDNAEVSTGTNAVIFTLTQQMTAEYGQTLMQISLTGEGQDPLGTANWIGYIEKSPTHGDPSETWIVDLNEAVDQAVDAAESAEQSVLDSEAWAVGERGGEAVTDVDPTYHNNAKYYAGQADESAQSASSSSSDASGYADAAGQSARDAAGSASDASGYADNASASAGEASGSATEAAGSARDAAGSALDAAGYSTAAGRSALDAEDSARAAAGSANSASGSESSASANALKSEGFAVGEQDGTPVASGSPYYHNNAEYYAGEASGSAASASDSAGAASGSAGTASTQALKSEGYAVGTQDGTPVASGSPYYENNSKYYADEAAAVAASIPEDYSDLSDDVANLKSAFEEFPEGTYPDMTVGGVMSVKGGTEDQVPYTLRASGGGVAVGNREIDEIVGGTVAWNQLGGEDLTGWSATNATVSKSSGEITITSSSDTAAVKGVRLGINNDHVYLASADFKSDGTAEVAFGFYASSGGALSPAKSSDWTTSTTYQHYATVSKPNQNFYVWCRLRNSVASGNYGIFKNVMLFDLTQMFGSTIADYIAALETATPGAGVAWFKRLFGADFYPYDSGSLKSVEGVSAHKMTGKNLCPLAEYTIPNDSRLHSIWTGDITGTFTISMDLSGTSATNPGAYFLDVILDGADTRFAHNALPAVVTGRITDIKVYGSSAYAKATGTIRQIQLEFGSTATAYEPYTAHTYPLDSSLTLQGVFKLDSANRLYANGDIYPSSGQVQRRYVLVDLGTLNWTATALSNSRTAFTTPYTGWSKLPKANALVAANAICPVASVIAQSASSWGVNTFLFNSATGTLPGGVLAFIFDQSKYTDAATFKAAMSGVYLLYEQATPTTETAEPYTNPQIVDASGTEEYVTTGIVPVGHYTQYPTDIVAKMDGLPSNFSTLIGPTEKGFTASKAYAVNSFLIVNNQFYRVTADIASGATLTPNTNIKATTIAEVLTELLNA